MHDIKWTVESNVEVPLTVLAPDWRTALCMGLQLLELEERVGEFHLSLIDGGATAYDPGTASRLRVTAVQRTRRLAVAA